MATYKYDENGNKVQMLRYEKMHAVTLADIFPLEQKVTKMLKKERWVTGNLAKQYRVQSLPKLVRLIFYTIIKKVLLRVANGDVFVLPGTTGAYIALKKLPDASARKILQKGRYSNYDIAKAGYVIPIFVFDFGPKKLRKDASIYVPRYISDIALRNAEERKIPWTTFKKRLDYDNST